MGIFGKEKVTYNQRPLLNACQCNPKIAYEPENFPYNDFPPPKPPNGQDDLWELQFCRWWGWNWVRKKEIEEMTNPNQETIMYGAKVDDSSPRRRGPPSKRKQSGCFSKREPEGSRRPKSNRRSPSSRSPRPQRQTCQCYQTRTYGNYPNSPLPTRRELKDLCKCIVFQKPSRELPPPELQNLYNTPSHSVVMERERYSFNRFNREPRFVPCEPKVVSHMTHGRERQRKKKSCATSWCGKPKHTISSEEVICSQQFSQSYQNMSTQARPASSTEESVEYLTVRMQHVKSDTRCPCQSHVPMPSKKQSVQTIPVLPPMKDVGCQCIVPSMRPSRPCMCPNDEKVIKYNSKKKKTLCICVCCCNCCKKDAEKTSEHDQKTSEIGGNPPKKESKTKTDPKSYKNVVTIESEEKPEKTTDLDSNANYEEGMQNQQDHSSKRTYLSTLSMPLSYRLNTVTDLPQSKQFSKFANPSKNFPWLNTSFSNDATMSILSDDTFTSPISGKTYNFAALQFHTNENTKLPDLLDTSEDLEYLKNIQSSIKNESEQKILFDAVCDALLTEPNNFDNESSKLVNEVAAFPDFSWPLLNNPSENNVTIPQIVTNNTTEYNQNELSSQSNMFKLDNESKFFQPLGWPLSNRPAKQNVKMPKKGPEENKLNINKVSSFATLTRTEPVNSFEKYEQKESFTSQEINAFIDKVLKVDTMVTSKISEPEVPGVFQQLLEKGNEGITNKVPEVKQKTIAEKRIFKLELINETPGFSKTGLLSAKGLRTGTKKLKRSALITPRESVSSKKYKPDEKLRFEKNNIISKIDLVSFDTGNPFLETETTRKSESIQEMSKTTSLEKAKGSPDNIFAKIDKIMENSKASKNDKLSINLSCLSEKSEPDDLNSSTFASNNAPPLKLNNVETKKKSYDAFSFGSASNRSEISSNNQNLWENSSERDTVDTIESKLDSVDKNSFGSISKKSTVNSARFQGTSLVTLGVKSAKRKIHLGSKSLIPIRKKQRCPK